MGTQITLTVTAKGQVTLKQSVLQHLGIKPGDAVTVDLAPSGSVTLRAAPGGDIADFFACLPAPRRTVSIEEMAQVIADGWAGLKPIADGCEHSSA